MENYQVQICGNLASAFSNCKALHNRIYKDLTDLDFQEVINNTKGCRSKLYNIQNLCKRLDKFALRKKIINESYAQFIEIDFTEEETSRKPYTNTEIAFLWTLEGDIFVDILLVLLYSAFRIEELLELETININLEKETMLGGLKTDNGKNRIIPLHSKILHIVKKYYNKNNKYLFVDKDRNKIKYDKYYQDFLKFKEANKENFDISHVIHETRHSACSEMDRHGANRKCRDMIMRT